MSQPLAVSHIDIVQTFQFQVRLMDKEAGVFLFLIIGCRSLTDSNCKSWVEGIHAQIM